jgi:hypothetical protein
MASNGFVPSGDVDRVRTRLRARFGQSVSEHAIDAATAAAFARYRSATVNNFVALLAERVATTQLQRAAQAPSARDITDKRRARTSVGAVRGLDEPRMLGGAA